MGNNGDKGEVDDDDDFYSGDAIERTASLSRIRRMRKTHKKMSPSGDGSNQS